MKKSQIDRLYKDVEFLTEIRPYRNYRNLKTLEKVCTYIKSEFEKFNFNVEEQTWKAKGNEYKNLIASYQKEKEQRLIVGAHYDVCGDQPGADDNASAVAGLLETARLLIENDVKLDYGIDFVAYCLEEPPFYGTTEMGSYVHAKSLKEKDVNVLGMICYEMIGYFSDEPNSQEYPTKELGNQYPSVANFIGVIGIDEFFEFNEKVYKLMSEDSTIDIVRAHFPDRDGLAGMSDQRNYWKFGYKALMINDTSFIRNPNYHLKSDTIDTLDFEKLSEVINSSYRAIIRMK